MLFQNKTLHTRLEDFCDGDTLHDTVATLLEHAGVSVNASVVAAAAATINFTKCQTDRWEVGKRVCWV